MGKPHGGRVLRQVDKARSHLSVGLGGRLCRLSQNGLYVGLTHHFDPKTIRTGVYECKDVYMECVYVVYEWCL